MIRSFHPLFALLFTTIVQAQTPGTLDLSFNPGDVGFGQTDGVGAASSNSINVKHAVLQPDGRLVMCGSFYRHDDHVRDRITRCMPNGDVDESFDPVRFSGGFVRCVAVQPDGKVLVGGNYETADMQPRLGLVRLNEDGSLDGSFDIGAGFEQVANINGSVDHLVLQPDGKVICAGSWATVNGVAMPTIARLNTDGSLDASFAIGTGFNGSVTDLALQPDGQVLVSGWFDEFNGTERDRIARLNTLGGLDASFAPTFGGGAGGDATLDLRPDGKIWFGGNWSSVNGQPRDKFVLLTSTGATDPSFVPPPATPETYVLDVAGQADGSLVVGWHINTPWEADQQFLTRYLADGTEDPLFAGPDFNGDVDHIIIDEEQHILCFGWFTRLGRHGESGATRLLPTGAVDPAWRQASAFDHSVLDLVRQPDGKLICAGLFLAYDERSANRIARLGPDGEHDTTFYATGIITDNVNVTAVQPDGRILVGGRWYPGRMMRLNADGSPDPTFTYGGPSIAVSQIVQQPDGKILVIAGNSVVRLMNDGSVDPGFTTGTGFNGTPQDLILTSDGRITVIGWFSMYNNEGAPQIVRLYSNGDRDATFSAGTGFGGYGPVDMERQSDGKLLITGYFTQYDGTPAEGMVRILANGTYDPSFSIGTGTDENIEVVKYGPDGKLYIGGSFTTVNGQSSPGLARLSATGSLDTGFDVGAGTYAVTDILFEPDQDLLIVGGFTSYDGVGRNRIARIFGGLSTGLDAVVARTDLTVSPNPSNGHFTVDAGNLDVFASPWLEVVDVTGRTVHQQRWTAARAVLDLDIAPGRYVVALRDGEQKVRSAPLVVK